MRILIDNSGYRLANYGDVAMLQAAVERVTHLWPDATIDVMTADATLLAAYCPQAHPLLNRSLSYWYTVRNLANDQIDLAGDLARLVLKRLPQRNHGAQPASVTRMWKGYIEGVRNADLVLAAGGGYINDTFIKHGSAVLDTLQEAVNHGKPAAILGHGFQPISDAPLRAKAEEVLPKLLVVGCREGKYGPDALLEMGVDPEKIRATGDDAIELAYRVRKPGLGDGIGVNLRMAWYSGVQQAMLDTLRTSLHEIARRHHAPLVSVPISMVSPADASSIRKLTEGYENVNDGDAVFKAPIDVMEHVGNCRVVVTGSYHAAVFALSQGISAIGLGLTPYYMMKFHGLHTQFGEGCYVSRSAIRTSSSSSRKRWKPRGSRPRPIARHSSRRQSARLP